MQNPHTPSNMYCPPDPTPSSPTPPEPRQTGNDFCSYIDYQVKYGEPDKIPRFCPIPKIKGLYHPSPGEFYKKFSKLECRVNKKLPGTLGSNNALSTRMRQSVILSSNRTNQGKTQFVLNGDQNGVRNGQPGGIPRIIRNRF